MPFGSSNEPVPSAARMLGKKRAPAPLQVAFSFDVELDLPAALPPERDRYQPIVLAEPEPPPVLKPAKVAPVAPEPAEPPKEPVLYSVRRLLAEVRGHLESSFGTTLHVEGEISNCRPAGSGHLYFTLKDGDAQLSVVMFRKQASLLRFRPVDGLHVEITGRISVYETRGQLQMIADWMKPRGEGALRLALEALERKLEAEGLFREDRKRPLPAFPHCIGIVTSATGAALRDIVHVVQRRHARLNLLVYPAVVQGPGCPASVIAGIGWFNRNPGRVDLILVTRGGGSFEDLNGFNDEALARAIAGSALPVVSAVGHEIDRTLADRAADLRAPTPSAAAEMITAAQHRIAERLAMLEARVRRGGDFHLLHARQRLLRLSAGQVLRRVQDQIALRHRTLDELRMRLHAGLTRQLTRTTRAQAARLAALEARLRRHDPTLRMSAFRQRLDATGARLSRLRGTMLAARSNRLARATGRLNALSPLAVLNRGYAIVYTEDGAVLRSPDEAAPESVIRARLAGGTLAARVLPTEKA